MKKKAIIFEKLGKSRTFLIYDEDKNEFQILGYFTIALQVLKIPNNLSNRKIKSIDGFSSKANGETVKRFPTILIGQLGKNSLIKNITNISGDEIIKYCFDRIFKGQECLGGRIVMLECKNIDYLKRFYEKYGFKLIDRNYKDNELLQYIKIFNEEEIM